jgi:hypothetical protein
MGHIVAVTEFLARGDASSAAARGARRMLQASIFDLNSAEDAASKGSRLHRDTAARLGRIVSATEQLGFATIAACWVADQGDYRLFESADADSYLALLRGLAEPANTGAQQPVTRALPTFAAPEVRELVQALRVEKLSLRSNS